MLATTADDGSAVAERFHATALIVKRLQAHPQSLGQRCFCIGILR
jgi:hypothetical protein